VTGLEFIDIFDEISSVQQEKSGVQMNQSCTINISCATAMLAVPNICAKACNPVAMTFFFWRQNNKSQEILLTITLKHDLFFFLETPFSVIRSTPLDR